MKRELNFWVIGGDMRQAKLAPLLSEDGHTVHAYALDEAGLTPASNLMLEEGLGQAALADCVVLPLVAGPRLLMTRNLLYTAVTRARRLVVVVGREQCMRAMVDNNYIDRRFSALDERLAAWLTN